MNFHTGIVSHLVVNEEILCFIQQVNCEPTRTINIKTNNYITVIKGYV
jgi:hypothetical protein